MNLALLSTVVVVLVVVTCLLGAIVYILYTLREHQTMRHAVGTSAWDNGDRPYAPVYQSGLAQPPVAVPTTAPCAASDTAAVEHRAKAVVDHDPAPVAAAQPAVAPVDKTLDAPAPAPSMQTLPDEAPDVHAGSDGSDTALPVFAQLSQAAAATPPGTVFYEYTQEGFVPVNPYRPEPNPPAPPDDNTTLHEVALPAADQETPLEVSPPEDERGAVEEEGFVWL